MLYKIDYETPGPLGLHVYVSANTLITYIQIFRVAFLYSNDCL